MSHHDTRPQTEKTAASAAGHRHVSIILDLRCRDKGELLVSSLVAAVANALRDQCTAAVISRHQPAPAAGQFGSPAPPTVSLSLIAVNGPTLAMPPTPVTADTLSGVHTAIASVVGKAVPTPTRSATDATVFHQLAINAASSAATEPAPAPSSHVVLLASCLGPGTNGPSFARLLPVMQSVPTSLTVVLVASAAPASTVPRDAFVTAKVRVVRPPPDARLALRSIAPVISVGLGLTPSRPVSLALSAIDATVDEPSTENLRSNPSPAAGNSDPGRVLQLTASSTSLVAENSSDWLRNVLAPPLSVMPPNGPSSATSDHHMATSVPLELVSAQPAATISEAWLCGVPVVLRVAGAAPGRHPTEALADADVLRSLCDSLRLRDLVLVLRSSRSQPHRVEHGTFGGPERGTAWFVALPWQAGDGDRLLVRQLTPVELRRADVTEPTADEQLDDATPPTDSDDSSSESGPARAQRFVSSLVDDLVQRQHSVDASARLDPRQLAERRASAALEVGGSNMGGRSSLTTSHARGEDGRCPASARDTPSSAAGPRQPPNRVSLHEMLNSRRRASGRNSK